MPSLSEAFNPRPARRHRRALFGAAMRNLSANTLAIGAVVWFIGALTLILLGASSSAIAIWLVTGLVGAAFVIPPPHRRY